MISTVCLFLACLPFVGAIVIELATLVVLLLPAGGPVELPDPDALDPYALVEYAPRAVASMEPVIRAPRVAGRFVAVRYSPATAPEGADYLSRYGATPIVF